MKKIKSKLLEIELIEVGKDIQNKGILILF